jgi:hypothetical protein
MSATELRRSFRQRFRAVTRQIWSLHVGRGLALTTVVVVVLAALAAAVDYVCELSWLARAVLLLVGAAIVGVVARRWLVRPALTWNWARVAAELEGLFPRLGQRVRTAAEHGPRSPEELLREGVSPALVAALEEETAAKAKPLPFQAARPVRPILLPAALALGGVALLVCFAVVAPEWRTALGRVALASSPYTNLTVTPSATVVDEGADVEIRATMSGRTRDALVLHVREVGDPDWRQESMDPVEDAFAVRLMKLRTTTEFFVTAGPERTPVQQVVVRHLLKIASTQVEVTAPAYTGVALATHDSGSFSAIQGSKARIRFELDRAPVEATLLLKNPARPKDPPQRIDLTVEDRAVSAELSLTADLEYSVEAKDADAMPLVANRHRVRVTADQAPTVWFDEPSESIEVHTLAEVRIRARARDDFGITRIGIVFQINNEEERTLIVQDVTEPHQREARAEQVLMLEQLLLTQKDCVAYYAFAEDNRPDNPQRTTTDLRFIDIRPFLRTYKLVDAPEEMPSGPQRDLIFLDEVIARQRFNLNQTMRLEMRAKVRLDLTEVEKIAAFENKLATQTHNLADFLLGLGVDGAAILSQAEEAMLSAVDSLQGGKFTTAINQERDALRYLMEARDTVRQALMKKPRAVRAQARAFDRFQRQKLRRPNEEAETLLEIAEDLSKLADEEEQVARNIAGPGPTSEKPGPGGEGPIKPEAGKGKTGDDPERERQDDIAGRATAIDKTAAKVKGLTDLARTRITDAAKAANAGADALGQGDRPMARKEVDRAGQLFRQASKQVGALAAEEVAQQIAAARDLANDIALQTAPTDSKKPGTGSGEEKAKLPGLGDAAEEAKTLKDVLEQIAGRGTEEAGDAARKVGGLLKGEDLKAAVERLEKAGAEAEKGERQDLSERFAALGQKLDQAYREAIAPRLEELARLEREAYELEQRAGAAADASDWRRLRQQASAFVERLETARLGPLASKELRDGLRSRGDAADTLIGQGLTTAHKQLVAKLQEFVAGDRFTSGNEAVPPDYRDLVDRYLRALSAGTRK